MVDVAVIDLAHVPFVDNHAHPLSLLQPSTPTELRSHFTEAHSPEMAAEFVKTAVHYRWAIRQLAGELGVEPDESSLLRYRSSVPFTEYAKELVQAANVECLLLDTGYPSPDEAYDPLDVERMTGVPVFRLLRIETLLQELILREPDLGAVQHAFDRVLQEARSNGYVGLKSIAAYRTGLQLEPVAGAALEEAFEPLQYSAKEKGSLRLATKPVIDYFVWRAVAEAARQGLPVQFHTGYGDPDVDLRLANPLHLRPLFEEPSLLAAPIVLLHESYPYTAEAAFLAASYANAYLDLAFSLPPLDRFGLQSVVETALAVAPAGKLMCSSDGTSIPEHYYLGAARARAVIASVLTRMVEVEELLPSDAEVTARLLLRDNALGLYRLDAG